MKKRNTRILQVLAVILAILIMEGATSLTISAIAQEKKQESTKSEIKTIQLLFVQSAKSITFTKDTLTLNSVSPTTLFFSDRQEQLVGHLTTEGFLKLWREGRDSYTSVAPKATLSIFKEDDQIVNITVSLDNPKLKGDDLIYDVKILEGKIPKESGASSLFIDILGIPLAPFSKK